MSEARAEPVGVVAGIADVLGLAHGPPRRRRRSFMSITSWHLLGGDKNPLILYAEQSKPSLRERVAIKCVKEDINQIYRFCRISDCL